MRLVDVLQISSSLTCFRVTFSADHNFIIKYMPGQPHQEAIRIWDILLFSALSHLTNTPQLPAPGCKPIGSRSTFNKTPSLCFGLPSFIQPLILDQGRRQMAVSALQVLCSRVSSLRLGTQKVCDNWESMRGFGLNTFLRLRSLLSTFKFPFAHKECFRSS